VPEKMPISESKSVLPQVLAVAEVFVATKLYQTLGAPVASVPLVLQVGNASFVAPTFVWFVSAAPQVMDVALVQLSLAGIAPVACNGT
jgi:hypothetical protein